MATGDRLRIRKAKYDHTEEGEPAQLIQFAIVGPRGKDKGTVVYTRERSLRELRILGQLCGVETEDTWRCHVCGEERPDHNIRVASEREALGGGAELKVNVRYCRDRAECRLEAPVLARRWIARAREAGA